MNLKLLGKEWNQKLLHGFGVNKPQRSRAGLGAHEDALGDVVEDLKKELGVGARLGRRLDLVRVQLARAAGLKNSVKKR